MDSEQYVIPFFLRPEKITAEKTAGFEGSCVVVEKIGPTCLEWNVSLRDAVSTTYPTHKDANRA